jgi:PIN domain nuclease of toxin-antitoxin system
MTLKHTCNEVPAGYPYKQLSGKAKIAIENPDNAKYLSIVSIWEIAIKLNKGKLELAMPFVELKGQMEINGFELLPISFEHTLQLCSLAHHHGDPFDRIIISQAVAEQFILISKDGSFAVYQGLQLLW